MAESSSAPEVKHLQDRGCELAEQGNWAGATDCFRKAIELEPSSAVLHELKAQCLLEQDLLVPALHAARAATQLSPAWTDAWLTLGRVARNGGHLRESVSSFRQAQVCVKESRKTCSEELEQELLEAQGLLQQELARQVGLPGLRIQEQPGGECGPSGIVWQAGILLAAYLVQHLPLDCLRGKRVLELGSGTGLVGITAAYLGAHVQLTDVAEAMPLLKLNVALNQHHLAASGGSMGCVLMDWQTPASCLEQQDWDIVVGSDLVYNAVAVPLLT
ncbi:hypothetical protein WJX84_008745, partial [Apatococcus fuscideae]